MRGAALLLTVLTGFTGLVYQVAWQKVLATLLGSHSEATAAVLGIFLGGLSVGYALFGRLARRLGRGAPAVGLLRAYGLMEGAIGLYALAFPRLFAALQALSLALPGAGEGAGFGLDLLLTLLLVGPPTLLMGATLPLLTQGLARSLEDASRLHSLVYGFNTVGAFAGALAAGFLLLPRLGLERCLVWMGWSNLAAGLGFLALHRVAARRAGPGAPAQGPGPGAAPLPEGFGGYAAVALLAGFAMMTLQTAMNRIGALSLGASPFTFAMVVATFVLCIALGSFAVSALPRIRPAHLALCSWGLVAWLLALYPAVEDAPYWTHVLRLRIADPAAGFLHFQAAVFLALLAVALVPLGLSGALLPLLFHHLRRRTAELGHVVGRLYAWNTVGSLLGALLGGYLLLFWIDLHHAYRLAVLALAVGAAILTPRLLPRGAPVAGLALAASLAALALQPPWDPERLMAGLFRPRQPAERFADGPDAYFGWLRARRPEGYLRFHVDDPTASVAVLETGGPGQEPGRSLVTNGKSDGNIPVDDLTQGLLALLPALFAERRESAFVVGFGTGMTAGELAALADTREVVVAEISPGVMQAARHFEALNRGALASPKTRVVRGDAYRALLRSGSRYDVIVSEPSNPWVTGVEMLYSAEFLAAARTRLEPGGVFAQWIHSYETDDATLALVLRTFGSVFGRVAVWRGRGTDLILLGFADDRREADLDALEARASRDDFRSQLAALGLGSLPALLAHEVLPVGVLGGMELPGEVHTLLHPRLGDLAARAFYRMGSGTLPAGLERPAAEAGARSSLVGSLRRRHGGSLPDPERRELLRETCRLDRSHCATLFAHWLHQAPDSEPLARALAEARAVPRLAPALEPRVLQRLAALFGPDATAGMQPSYELARDVARVFAKYYTHAAPFPSRSLRVPWLRCAPLDPRCAAELARVTRLGTGGPLLSRR